MGARVTAALWAWFCNRTESTAPGTIALQGTGPRGIAEHGWEPLTSPNETPWRSDPYLVFQTKVPFRTASPVWSTQSPRYRCRYYTVPSYSLEPNNRRSPRLFGS